MIKLVIQLAYHSLHIKYSDIFKYVKRSLPGICKGVCGGRSALITNTAASCAVLRLLFVISRAQFANFPIWNLDAALTDDGGVQHVEKLHKISKIVRINFIQNKSLRINLIQNKSLNKNHLPKHWNNEKSRTTNSIKSKHPEGRVIFIVE